MSGDRAGGGQGGTGGLRKHTLHPAPCTLRSRLSAEFSVCVYYVYEILIIIVCITCVTVSTGAHGVCRLCGGQRSAFRSQESLLFLLWVLGSQLRYQGSRQGLSLTDHLTNPGMGLGQGMTSSAWHSGN